MIFKVKKTIYKEERVPYKVVNGVILYITYKVPAYAVWWVYFGAVSLVNSFFQEDQWRYDYTSLTFDDIVHRLRGYDIRDADMIRVLPEEIAQQWVNAPWKIIKGRASSGKNYHRTRQRGTGHRANAYVRALKAVPDEDYPHQIRNPTDNRHRKGRTDKRNWKRHRKEQYYAKGEDKG